MQRIGIRLQRLAMFLQHPRNLLITAGVLSGGVVCIKLSPHVLPGLIFRPFYQANTDGLPCQLTPSQKREFLQACRDLGVTPKGYEVFVANTIEITWRGLPWLGTGVKFGIPQILADNPDLSTERFSDLVKSNMDSEETAKKTNKLQDALRVGQSARKFALAKDIALIEKNFPMYSITLAPLVVSAHFGLVALMQITAAIGLPNYFLLLLTCVPFYCMYQLLMSSLRERTDLKVDENLAKLGPEYIAGGIEYYEKRLMRNSALRKLMGKKGERLFTFYGNEKAYGVLGIRSYGAALTRKLDNMRHAAKES